VRRPRPAAARMSHVQCQISKEACGLWDTAGAVCGPAGLVRPGVVGWVLAPTRPLTSGRIRPRLSFRPTAQRAGAEESRRWATPGRVAWPRLRGHGQAGRAPPQPPEAATDGSPGRPTGVSARHAISRAPDGATERRRGAGTPEIVIPTEASRREAERRNLVVGPRPAGSHGHACVAMGKRDARPACRPFGTRKGTAGPGGSPSLIRYDVRLRPDQRRRRRASRIPTPPKANRPSVAGSGTQTVLTTISSMFVESTRSKVSHSPSGLG